MIVASLGPLAIAANQILLNANRMTRMPGHGFAIAATILVGQSLGAEKKKRALESGIEAARLALVILSAAGLFYFFFPNLVALLFTRDLTVVEMARHPLMLLAFSQPAAAFLLAMTGGLRGAGDTRWAMFITLFSMLVVRLALTILLVLAGLGLTGIWLAMLVESYFRATFLYLRFRNKIPQIKPLVSVQ